MVDTTSDVNCIPLDTFRLSYVIAMKLKAMVWNFFCPPFKYNHSWRMIAMACLELGLYLLFSFSFFLVKGNDWRGDLRMIVLCIENGFRILLISTKCLMKVVAVHCSTHCMK